MYESFFKLQRRPFSTTPDPSCVYLSNSTQTVLDELVVCLERGEGIAVLTAPAGLGKTLLCEKVRQELGAGFVTILLRHGHFSSPADLLKTILAETGHKSSPDSVQELRLQLIAALHEMRHQGKLLTVICDEAHELTEELLKEFRQLVDHADHGVSWVRLLLAGQLELEEKLAGTELSALNQRLRSHVALSALSTQEALDYIDYRITWAGGRIEEVFHPDALTAIVDAADGIPRCLNQLCDHVLLLAYVAEQQPAPPELVSEALSDLQHLPLTWNVRATRRAAAEEHPATTVESAAKVTSGSTVEFGEHLSTWESSPTFGAAASETGDDQVWEFGADTEPPADSPVAPRDPFEHLLHQVETELDQIEAARASAAQAEPQIQEEPVVDRYAAIDAGWPVDHLPREAQPRWDADEALLPSTSARSAITQSEDRVEQQIRADVLELVTATQDAMTSRRFDSEASPAHQPPTWVSTSVEAVETAAPTISPDRPFRNLFTRLRRKQKGLE